MKLTPVALVAAAALAPFLVSCGSSGSSASSPASSSPSGTAARATASPTPTPPTASPSLNGVGRIGGAAVKLTGDVTVGIGAPKRYAMSGNSAGSTRTGNVLSIYPVTVTNDGSTPIDMTLTAVTALADGEQVDMISDSEHRSDDQFTGTLLPGKTMKATYGFQTRKGDEGRMQVEVFVGSTGQSHGVFTDSDSTT